MAWFQRYGFPGAFFWGFLLLWLTGIYYCEFCSFLAGDLAKIVGAIAAASFLPIGYLISVLQQSIYIWCKKPQFGITGPAIKESGVFCDTTEREYLLEAEACLVVMSKKVKVQKGQKQNEPEVDVDKQRFFQDWIRSRNNVMAINGSVIIAGILAFVTAISVPRFCLGWEVQVDTGWLLFAALVTVLVLLVLFLSWVLLRREVIRVEAGAYKILADLPGSNLTLKDNVAGENTEIKDDNERPPSI
jgi:hypothetical protein